MQLVQVKRCDGACCRESPRFPNADHSDCIFHDTSGGKETAGCMLMTGAKTLRGDEQIIKYEGRTRQSIFEETCVAWPQKNSVPEVGNTGNCCWQWVE